MCFACEGGYCCGRTPPAIACGWPVVWAAMPVWREKSATTITESIWEREKRVLMVEGSDT